MTCRGIAFALSDEELARLLASRNDAERLVIVEEEIEARWDEAHLCQFDKSWDAMHHCLAAGSETSLKPVPCLERLLLGGEQLYAEDDYIMSLVTGEELPALVRAARQIDRTEFRRRYDSMSGCDYPKSDNDFDYTRAYFDDFLEFVTRASQEGRAVLFTVAQGR